MCCGTVITHVTKSYYSSNIWPTSHTCEFAVCWNLTSSSVNECTYVIYPTTMIGWDFPCGYPWRGLKEAIGWGKFLIDPSHYPCRSVLLLLCNIPHLNGSLSCSSWNNMSALVLYVWDGHSQQVLKDTLNFPGKHIYIWTFKTVFLW